MIQWNSTEIRFSDRYNFRGEKLEDISPSPTVSPIVWIIAGIVALGIIIGIAVSQLS